MDKRDRKAKNDRKVGSCGLRPIKTEPEQSPSTSATSSSLKKRGRKPKQTEGAEEEPERQLEDELINFGLRASSPNIAQFIKNLFG